MYRFENLTSVNGLDYNNLKNARQNNYCWSISELDDYIYVGTGRNLLLVVLQMFVDDNLNVPTSIYVKDQDNRAEIWRYKKNCPNSWEKVFKLDDQREYGFRYMIKFKSFNGNPALYAASATVNGNMKVYKSVNGTVWNQVLSDVQPKGKITGTSSRAMLVHNNKIYLAAIDETGQGQETLLYSSRDPEFFPWKLETPQGTNPNLNPQGGITNMAVFNNHIYVATSGQNGVQVWKTNSESPKVNDWTLIMEDKYDDNKYSLSMGVFRNYLYVSKTKELPLSWAIPRGCDIVRIDKYDNYEVVIGPGSISGIWSGFNNPFNVYAWQMEEYDNKLFVTTFDDSINMQLILELLLKNKDKLELPEYIVNLLIETYEIVVKLLNLLDYPFGFNLFVSKNGIDFEPVFLDGLENRYNYGGRILYVDENYDLYIGTANPYQGLEVWKTSQNERCCCNNKIKWDFNSIEEELERNYLKLQPYLLQLQNYLQPMFNRYGIKN